MGAGVEAEAGVVEVAGAGVVEVAGAVSEAEEGAGPVFSREWDFSPHGSPASVLCAT